MWRGSARQACVVVFAYRPECMKHAAKCLARLIDVLLGAGAASLKKLEWGASLCILGIEFEFAEHGFRCRPSKAKAQKWLRCVRGYLATGKMTAGEASKIAGRLSWAGAHMFRRLGRAMLRPIFDQTTRRDAKIDAPLRRALLWWIDALALDVAETRAWDALETRVAHLFCDAAGEPAHLGAVLLLDGKCYWTHLAVSEECLAFFRAREDKQIMGLELLSISLGMCTFEQLLCGRRVVVHSDNSGSEWALRRGCARRWDHAQLVHQQWLHALKMRLALHVVRVDTHDNIADLPSRRVRVCSGVTRGCECFVHRNLKSLPQWTAKK